MKAIQADIHVHTAKCDQAADMLIGNRGPICADPDLQSSFDGARTYVHQALVRERLTSALSPVLAPEARVVVESDSRAPLALDLALTFERRYGDTLIRIYAA